MKVQLTSTKSIDIDFSKFGKAGKSSSTDLVGVELFPPTPSSQKEIPAVRIYRKKNAWHLGAAAMVPPPEGDLPEQWDEMVSQPTWTLPHNFQAPCAAIAVNSGMGLFGQASPEAIVSDMIHGVEIQESFTPAQDLGGKRLGVIRLSPKPKAKPAPQPAGGNEKKPEIPPPGVPVAENGRRFVVKPSAEEGFLLSASLPEFQTLWLSRLLPEGRRPTAKSIQLSESALMASVLAQPMFQNLGGSMLAMMVRPDSIYFAGYKAGMPVLWRRCPRVGGSRSMRDAIKRSLGIGEDLVQSVLEDALIDPRAAMENFLHPILDQLDLARAYLAGKHSMKTEKVLLAGLPYGAKYWKSIAAEMLKVELVDSHPFAGITIDKGVEVANPHDYIVALGAALAASEVQS